MATLKNETTQTLGEELVDAIHKKVGDLGNDMVALSNARGALIQLFYMRSECDITDVAGIIDIDAQIDDIIKGCNALQELVEDIKTGNKVFTDKMFDVIRQQMEESEE